MMADQEKIPGESMEGQAGNEDQNGSQQDEPQQENNTDAEPNEEPSENVQLETNTEREEEDPEIENKMKEEGDPEIKNEEREKEENDPEIKNEEQGERDPEIKSEDREQEEVDPEIINENQDTDDQVNLEQEEVDAKTPPAEEEVTREENQSKQEVKDSDEQEKDAGVDENQVDAAEQELNEQPEDDAQSQQGEVDVTQPDAEGQENKDPEEIAIDNQNDELQAGTDVGTGTEANGDKHETDPHAPSPESRFDLTATATVKFVLMPSGQVATMRCHLGQTFGQLKGHFASELKIDVSIILMLFDGKSLSDDMSLGELGVGPNGSVQLEIQSSDPMNNPIRPVQKRQEYLMPDVITVRVQTENGTYQDVVVEIERPVTKKPFLGGYRHKETGAEFHHASAQTMAKLKPPSAVERFCRDTQTSEQRHQNQQTTNAMSTQMTKIGVYVSNMQDKMVSPGKYITADEHQKTLLENIVIIQKYYRRWLARKYVDKVRTDMSDRREWEREEEVRKKKEKEDRIRKEFERRMNPKTKEDFDLLYHALEKWRQEETDRIDRELTGAERKAALCQLLEQETQLIASIGRHKIDANDENKLSKIQSFLNKAATPKRWKGPDGGVTEMDTPYTLRAQQLRDIYNTINMKYLTQDERLDILLTLKHTVKEHECKLTQEIIELIDREADLLMRGVKENNLDGLRKRISTLFLQYCKTPLFNPEITRLLKVPQDPSSLKSNIYFCSSCNQYLPSTDFQLSSKSSKVGRCRRCLKMDNEARVRQDHSNYRFMLKALRRSEENYGDDSKIAFLLQESDLRHLVENVWGSQSTLSAWQDLYDLVLVRWDKHNEWAPWNCILLTKEEASAHEKLEDLTDAYGKAFVQKVKHKHTLARNYFSRLPGMAEHMRRAASAKLQHANQGPSVSGKAVPIRVT